jgi:hypothetical protein
VSSPNRIQFKYLDLVLSEWVSFTCAINPIEFDAQTTTNKSVYKTMGEPLHTSPAFDSRVRSMSWRNLPNKEPYTTMLQNLSNMQYVASGVLMMRRDLDITASSVWEPIRVLSVGYTLAKGPASATNYLSFSEVNLQYTLRSE